MLARETLANRIMQFNNNFKELLFCDEIIVMGLAGQSALLSVFRSNSYLFFISLIGCGAWQFISAETYAKRFIFKTRHDNRLEDLVKTYNILKLDKTKLSSQEFLHLYQAISPFVPRSLLTHMPLAPLPSEKQSNWQYTKGKLSSVGSFFLSFIKTPDTEAPDTQQIAENIAPTSNILMQRYCTYVCGYQTQSLYDFFMHRNKKTSVSEGDKVITNTKAH